MISREAWKRAMHFQDIERIPFFPKLAEPYCAVNGGTVEEHYQYLGCDRFVFLKPVVVEKHRDCHREVVQEGDTITEKYVTPVGTIISQQKYDGAASVHPVKMPIEDEESIKIMTRWYEDISYEISRENIESNRKIKENTPYPTRQNIGTSPLMSFLENFAGIAEGNYMLVDYPDEVEELFAVMHARLLEKVKLSAPELTAEHVFFMENTSTTYISPAQFREFCVPKLNEYADAIKAVRDDDISVTFHMCGHLKLLLEDLNQLHNDSFEAFTAPPTGNTPLELGRQYMPNKAIIDGTDATLWLRPANEIIEFIEATLDKLPHHRGIVISSAGQMPPGCAPETIKKVSDWLSAYQPRL